MEFYIYTGDSEQSKGKPKARKVTQATSSLRSPAVAAANRLRHGYISKRGNTRYIDPDVETKQVNAYCATEKYNLSVVVRLLQREGYTLDPYQTGLHREVVHFRMTYFLSHVPGESGKEPTDIGDVFIFPSGTVVTWNIPTREGRLFVESKLSSAIDKRLPSVPMETEEFNYLEDPSRENSTIVGDTILLGTKPPAQPADTPLSADEIALASETDTTLAKIAYSSGLARSTKLAVLENQLDTAFDDTRPIIAKLSEGTKLPFTRKFIIAKIGDILNLRAQLNLYSDLTDPLPDYFWDSRHDLGLERYYHDIGHALDINDRIELLNKKINYTQEIAGILREQLSERHGIRLEWTIIILITIEVFFELYRMYKEYRESHDLKSTENMLRRYLETAGDGLDEWEKNGRIN
ncbi:DUF155-domain-containing protein [Pseudovirgaria hyperparasitica]|uniref:DUF155-domain-containing protein n=1 Tax=Pseudovirgaria hyperparasitica TaxID=470096 RepID=A0A6A6W5Q5_9PEZI|nr:DUF155-domain-containing protein [Pseudovirgaria hyperparasitica]KAF2758212.1 DUF155-domain-containing protein [Pseudovirgaria hyperparasitica]